MGNVCVGPTLGNNGFLQSITAAIWRTRQPENTLPSANAAAGAITNKTTDDDDDDVAKQDHPDPLVRVQSTPPEPVKIVSSEGPTKRVDTTKSVKRENTFARGMSYKVPIEGAGAKSTKPPGHVKRASSVGLHVVTFTNYDRRLNCWFQ